MIAVKTYSDPVTAWEWVIALGGGLLVILILALTLLVLTGGRR